MIAAGAADAGCQASAHRHLSETASAEGESTGGGMTQPANFDSAGGAGLWAGEYNPGYVGITWRAVQGAIRCEGDTLRVDAYRDTDAD